MVHVGNVPSVGTTPRRDPARSARGLSWRTAAISLLLLSLAFAFRMIGIDWGGFHADEHPSTAAKVLTGQLVDEWAFYPPLLNYVTAVLFAAYYVLGKTAGLWHDTAGFRAAFFEHRLPFFIILRIVTALWSALLAPLVYLFALRLRQSMPAAVLAGLLCSFIPANEYLAHFGKSDNGLAAAYMLVCIAGLAFAAAPMSRKRQFALAAATAFALSVKHSAAFLLVPLGGLIVFALWRDGQGLATSARACLGVILFTALVWLPLNIGIVLDPKGFLAAQVVQSQMSARNVPWSVTAAVFLDVATGEGGIPTAILLLYALAPIGIVMQRDGAARFSLWCLWIPVTVSILAVGSIVGDRQPIYLWLPQLSLMTVTVVLILTGYLTSGPRLARIAATVALAAISVVFVSRCYTILAQALDEPLARRLAAEIQANVRPDEKILSTVPLAGFLDLSSQGAAYDRQRHERLAAKYRVKLPETAQEALREKATGYTVASFPLVVGGLEFTDPAAIKAVVAYAWPLQPEEWVLDYWLERGFRVMVLSYEDNLWGVPAYRPMLSRIYDECQVVTKLKSKRPLFNDYDVSVYRC